MFKPGDKVVLKDYDYDQDAKHLVLGKIYEVIQSNYLNLLSLKGDNNLIGYYHGAFRSPTPEELERENFPQKLEDLLK